MSKHQSKITDAEIFGESPVISKLPVIIEPIEVEQEDVPYCYDEINEAMFRGIEFHQRFIDELLNI